MSRKSFQADLRRYGMRRVFDFKRRCDPESICGFVACFSDSLVLLHNFQYDCFALNGYTAIRDQDIKRYRYFGSPNSWRVRALAHFKIKPERPLGVSVVSVSELLTTAASLFPLMTIHCEYIDPDVCYIGPLVKMTDRLVIIEKLDATGAWDGPRRFRLADITRVDFGGGYELALAVTAPKRRSRKNQK